MFELGRALIILKEHTEHGRFMESMKSQFGLGIARNITSDVSHSPLTDPANAEAAPKLMDLGKPKLLELLVEEDAHVGGNCQKKKKINSTTTDDVGPNDGAYELQVVALSESRRKTLAAKDEVMKTKTAKIDERTEGSWLRSKPLSREPEGRKTWAVSWRCSITSLEVRYPQSSEPFERFVRPT